MTRGIGESIREAHEKYIANIDPNEGLPAIDGDWDPDSTAVRHEQYRMLVAQHGIGLDEDMYDWAAG
jgi:hypothetical protein